MIREVVYEGYVPRRETVDLAALLDGKRAASGDNGSTGSNRFPLFSTPDPFPHLLLDPQLIRKIYQNAVSNACKYGKRGGDVKTFLTYDAGSHIFRMEVFNHPGYNHDALLHLGDNEMDGVFQESTQLEVNQDMDTKEGRLASARSAGDGAWIMQKCAQCLGGDCEISYTPRGTTLTFECPATVSSDWKKTHSSSASVSEAFAIPPSTWAIAVEDSPMQQKLLARFLKQSDFPDERVRILGKKAEELYNFTDIIQNLMMDNPKDKFILIIDENLDIVEGGTGKYRGREINTRCNNDALTLAYYLTRSYPNSLWFLFHSPTSQDAARRGRGKDACSHSKCQRFRARGRDVSIPCSWIFAQGSDEERRASRGD